MSNVELLIFVLVFLYPAGIIWNTLKSKSKSEVQLRVKLSEMSCKLIEYAAEIDDLREKVKNLNKEIDEAPTVVCCDMHEGKACGMWSKPAPWNKDANTEAKLIRIKKKV